MLRYTFRYAASSLTVIVRCSTGANQHAGAQTACPTFFIRQRYADCNQSKEQRGDPILTFDAPKVFSRNIANLKFFARKYKIISRAGPRDRVSFFHMMTAGRQHGEAGLSVRRVPLFSSPLPLNQCDQQWIDFARRRGNVDFQSCGVLSHFPFHRAPGFMLMS